MNEGIVIQLQKEAINDESNIETLLMKALLIAKKLHLKNFEDWVKKEQEGYSGKVPNYRIIGGEMKAWNPYHGWIPVIFPEKKAMDYFNRMSITTPISGILEAYNSNENSIGFVVSGEMTEYLNKKNSLISTKYTFYTSKAELRKIISTIRSKILEWALLLEENGILGDGLTFTDQEKQVAKQSQVVNYYTNVFCGATKNTQIQQGGNDNTQEKVEKPNL